MPAASEITTTKGNGPRVRQLSVFLPNRMGMLLELVKRLNERHVEVLALNVQEAADSAIVRVVVSDPDAAARVLHEAGIACAATEFVVVELERGAETLGRLLAALLVAEVNIHGCYALMTRPRGRTALALHVEDNDCATAVLAAEGFRLLSQADLSR